MVAWWRPRAACLHVQLFSEAAVQHATHDGLSSSCGCRRVDVGLSRGCGNAEPQALEIVQDRYLYRILADGSRVALNDEARQAARDHATAGSLAGLAHAAAQKQPAAAAAA